MLTSPTDMLLMTLTHITAGRGEGGCRRWDQGQFISEDELPLPG